MEFRISEGTYEKLGIIRKRDYIMFTFVGEREDVCSVVLIDKDTGEKTKIPVPTAYCIGSLWSVRIHGVLAKKYNYVYDINGTEVMDAYAPVVCGRETWENTWTDSGKREICGGFIEENFDWKGDVRPEIPAKDMVMYKLNVRGFTMDKHASNSYAGTFRAVGQKLTYLKSLGVTTVEFMPVYEFEERLIPEKKQKPDYIFWEGLEEDLIVQNEEEPEPKVNLWGYGSGNYFAVKSSFAQNPKKASTEFKKLIKKMHECGLECILEMHFPLYTDHNLIVDALRHWVLEYHVDGFHLIGDGLPMMAIWQDALLSRSKIFYKDIDENVAKQDKNRRLFVYKEEYQYPIRRLLNHSDANICDFADQQRKQGEAHGFVNFIASNNGFTLADLFMYNDKHNEANGENNQDGEVWNFSTNYGVEGPTKRRFIANLRKRQWKNAILMMFLAQGVPLLLAGDEFGNSQSGNNNAYCQDNSIGWVNWRGGKAVEEDLSFVQQVAAFRREHPILSKEKPFQFSDYKKVGCPDLSFHGENAWISPSGNSRACIGLLYCGEYSPDEERTEDIYVAYNFFSMRTEVALPKLSAKKKWYKVIDTAASGSEWNKEEVLFRKRQYISVEAQAICVLVGK